MQSDLDDDSDSDELSSIQQLQPGQIANLPPLHELVGRNWITFKQMARLIGVTYQTIIRYKRTGKFRPVRIGGRWRVYEEELRRFLSEGNLKE